jgi:predicted RNA binding protein YcfA (HicA-like mRNA interferase family)
MVRKLWEELVRQVGDRPPESAKWHAAETCGSDCRIDMPEQVVLRPSQLGYTGEFFQLTRALLYKVNHGSFETADAKRPSIHISEPLIFQMGLSRSAMLWTLRSGSFHRTRSRLRRIGGDGQKGTIEVFLRRGVFDHRRGERIALTFRKLCVYIHTVRSREVITALKGAGWREVARKGSHVQFKHPQHPGRVTVPHPERDIPIGTLRNIERQSGLQLRK